MIVEIRPEELRHFGKLLGVAIEKEPESGPLDDFYVCVMRQRRNSGTFGNSDDSTPLFSDDGLYGARIGIDESRRNINAALSYYHERFHIEKDYLPQKGVRKEDFKLRKRSYVGEKRADLYAYVQLSRLLIGLC